MYPGPTTVNYQQPEPIAPEPELTTEQVEYYKNRSLSNKIIRSDKRHKQIYRTITGKMKAGVKLSQSEEEFKDIWITFV